MTQLVTRRVYFLYFSICVCCAHVYGSTALVLGHCSQSNFNIFLFTVFENFPLTFSFPPYIFWNHQTGSVVTLELSGTTETLALLLSGTSLATAVTGLLSSSLTWLSNDVILVISALLSIQRLWISAVNSSMLAVFVLLFEVELLLAFSVMDCISKTNCNLVFMLEILIFYGNYVS